ncbi:MAG: membrane integrity-associated transporter subunit PqiC [Magnetococcales bacterium]|nr:membrane integrity-associated transporter subunit PqiC [Magnetococcales bacterium]
MNHRVVGILAMALLALSACSSVTTPTQVNHFYLISALTEQDPGQQASQPIVADHGPTVEIAPVTLPSYLNRPHIVTRRQADQLDISESHQWGGELAENLSRVLEENLALLLQTHRIVEPRQRLLLPADLRVTVQILHFERSGDHNVQLIARWRLSRRDRTEPLLTRRSDLRIPIAADAGYPTIVAAMSQAFAALTREMATEITRMGKL